MKAVSARKLIMVFSAGVALFAGMAEGVEVSEALRPRLVAYRSFKKELKETAAFANLGVELRAVGICNTVSGRGAPYSDYPPVWLGPGKYDWESCDRAFDDVIAASPNAKFMALVDLNTPPWLARKMRIDSFGLISHAASSPEWRETTSKWLRDFVAHVEERYGDRIVAYVPLAGQTTEWWENDAGVSSREKNAAWREWCRANGRKYRPHVPPETDIADAAFENVLYDPATEREKIDYLRFHNAVVADAILGFASDIRRIVGSRRQIGVFFGYMNIDGKQLATQCHMDYERVMASPDIDFCISPATYRERDCGFGTGSQSVAGTLRRYGKRLLHEIDFWPHDLRLPWRGSYEYLYFRSAADDIAGNMRDAAFAFVNGCSWWYFDMYGGFYRTPGMHERIRRMTEVEHRFHGQDFPSTAQVLVVADAQSCLLLRDPPGKTSDGFAPLVGCLEYVRNRVGVGGFPYETCSFNDLAHLDLRRYRLIALPATLEITQERERFLLGSVCRDGRTVLWTYAPGISNGDSLDPARVKKWAGVDFRTSGLKTTQMPGGWVSAYAYDYRELTSPRLRDLAAAAGVFMYSEEPMPVAANERFFAVHCAKGGRKVFYVPSPCAKAVDVFTGKEAKVTDGRFEMELASPDTKLFELVH